MLIFSHLFLGSRKSGKAGEDLGLSNLRRNPWSMSSDSTKSPRSPVGERPVAPSQYLPPPRPSLLENQPFTRGGLTKQGSQGEQQKVRPFDLSDLGLSDNGTSRNRGYPGGHPSLWSSSDQCYNNPDSLFSSSSRASEEQFPGKSTRHSNNWVNFLDASNTNGGVVSNNKTMAEIWDVGNSPLDSDGWAIYSPRPPVPGQVVSSEADAVDALFSQIPDWSGAGTGPESPFSTQEVSWTPPPDVSTIWGNGYLGATSTAESFPTSSGASFVTYPAQPPQNQDSVPTFDPLLGSSIWNPSSASSTWSPTSE